MRQPFDRTNIGIRERPVSSDLNRESSQEARTITDVIQQLFGGSASPRSGFIGTALSVSAESPASMSVTVNAGMGFKYDASDVPTDIGGPDLEGVDDVSPYKPIALVSPVTFTVPAAPGAPNTRIDIIECRVNRQLVDSTPRFQLDTGSKTYLPKSFYKTLSFVLDGFVGTVTTPADSTAALSYKIGSPANPGVAPATTSGYVKLAEIHVGSAVTVINATDVVDSRLPLVPVGSYLGRQIFPTTGVYTPSSGTSRIRIRMQGGGGGGGGSQGGGDSAAAGGGASGVQLDFELSGAIVGGAVTIGAAGAIGAAGNNSGGAGGDTTLVINGTTYTAKGGDGGFGGANTVLGLAHGGAPLTGSSTPTGVVTSADVGGYGIVVATGGYLTSGAGGSGPNGIGGAAKPQGSAGVGQDARGYGAGGGGAASAGANAAGGAASAGVVIIDEYA